MLDAVPFFLTSCLYVLPIYLFFWLLQIRTQNANSLDALWALSMPMTVLLFIYRNPTPLENPNSLGLVLITLWSLRLSAHLILRSTGRGESYTYRFIRERWPRNTAMVFLVLFFCQWLLASLLSLFLLPVLFAKPNWIIGHQIGLGLGILFIVGQTIADFQLYQFQRNPLNRGYLLRTGLWKFSRHPNYFFEWLHWCVYPLLALGTFWAFLTCVIPLAMYLLTTRVTGISILEKENFSLEKEKYSHEVSLFFPRFGSFRETSN